MLIHNCQPVITADGHLEFCVAGLTRSIGRVEPWQTGFHSYQTRGSRTAKCAHWTLSLFQQQCSRVLPVPVAEFLAQIPAELRQAVSQFEFGQCPLLESLANYPAAADVFATNPTLCWLLNTAIFDSVLNREEIPTLLQAKQVEILARIAGCSSKAALRLVRKVRLSQGSLTEARALRRALGNRHMLRITRHLAEVPVGLLRILARFPNLANPAIARILAEDIPDDYHASLIVTNDLADTIRDVYRMAGALGIECPDRALSQCRSIDDIRQLHDRWVDRVNRRGELWIQPARLQHLQLDPDHLASVETRLKLFPEPPLPSSANIQAITSIPELAYEGQLQRNCVASYAASIASREVFIYKVLRPHRATLEVRMSADGWRLGQLKLFGNQVPGETLKRAVEDWFLEHVPLRPHEQDSSFADPAA